MPKALPILLALLLLALSVAAAAVGLASMYQVEAETLIEGWGWEEDGAGSAAAAWEEIQRYLWLANRLAPFDADILDDLGLLYELRVDAATAPGGPDARADLEDAVGYYRQSLARRPAWPKAWENVAMLKLKQGHIDAEFALALQRALELGPWDSIVQASLASVGLAVWDTLPAQQQTAVEHAISRGLSRGSRFMSRVVMQYGLIAADG